MRRAVRPAAVYLGHLSIYLSTCMGEVNIYLMDMISNRAYTEPPAPRTGRYRLCRTPQDGRFLTGLLAVRPAYISYSRELGCGLQPPSQPQAISRTGSLQLLINYGQLLAGSLEICYVQRAIIRGRLPTLPGQGW